MVDYLEQLLSCPRCSVLCAKIIKNKKRNIPYILKSLVISDAIRRGGIECRPQMVKKVGDNREECPSALVGNVVVGDGSGEMSLSSATTTHEEKPWFARTVRIGSIGLGLLKCLG